jgi:hypothetical protein
VIAGFRKHSANRGRINDTEVELEMEKVRETLISPTNIKNLEELKKVLNIHEKRRKLVKHKGYKLLPYFIFKNYILDYKKKALEAFNTNSGFACYYTIQFVNGKWVTKIEPMVLKR